ncbi:MAG: radical SAM protein [Gemmatimonadota bacterium]
MKKILFIQPSCYDDDGVVIKKRTLHFVGLAFPIIAALTPDDWEVEVCVELIEKVPFDTDAEVVGIGGMGQSTRRGIDLAKEFKRRGKTVIMGGPMVTLAPEFAAPFCDSIVRGSAETVWEEVLDDLRLDRLKPEYFRPLESLSTPLPKYEVVLDKRIGDFLPVQAARGCVHSCRFCTIYCMYRNTYFRREIPEIVRDIRHVKSLGFKKFLLLDDNIMSDREFMLDLCRQIRGLDMTWMSQCVIDIGRDPEMLETVRDSGCTALSFGLESINPASLKDIHKAWARPMEYASLIETISAAGIDVQSEMIVGVDSDTPESLRETIDFVAGARIIAPKFYLMTPIPGTDLFDDMQKQGRIVIDDLFAMTSSKPSMTHPNMTTEELGEIYWEIYDRLYTIPKVLRRTIFQKYFFRAPRRYFFYLLVNLFYRYQVRRRIGPIVV